MSKTVENAVEQLRLTTQSRLDQIQVECAPFLADKFVRIEENQYGFMLKGQLVRITVADDFRAFKVNGLRFIYRTATKEAFSRRDWLKNMVDDKIVYPFLLFNHGRVIPWSKIEVVRDYNYSYILVHGIGYDEVDLHIIEFPCEVRYGENDDILPEKERSLGLYFDRYGRLSYSDIINVRLEITDPDIYGDIKSIDMNTFMFSIDPEWGHMATTMSMVAFKDGILYPNGADELQYKGWNNYANMVTTLDDYYKYRYVVFFSERANKENSHMFHPAIEHDFNNQRIKDFGRYESVTYLDQLFKLTRFDFRLDPEKNIKQNMSDALDYIIGYDANLIDEAYKRETNVFCDQYVGQQLLDRAAANGGVMTVSRKRCGKFDSFLIMFVNGALYKWTKLMKYDNNLIHIPIRDINPSDKIEFVFFTDAVNINNTLVVHKGEPVYIYPGYNMETISLFTNDKHGLVYDVFDIDPDGRTQFEIPFTYKKTDIQNYYLIEFEDEWYYDHTLTISSNKQMRHATFTYEDVEKEENSDYYFLLPTDFNFCHQKSHYIVMLNGRMLSKQNFTVTETSLNRPFDKLYVYITTQLEEDDIVDVFYLPCTTVDSVWIDELDVSGDIVVDTSKIDMPISSNNYFVFVDGLKVDPRDVINISRNRLRITTSYGSLHNVLLMKYNPDIAEIKEAFTKTTDDEWSRYIDSLNHYDLNMLIGDFTNLSGQEGSNYMDYMYPLSTIVSDIVFDYYVRRAGLTKKNDVFVYDFEAEAAGNTGENTGVTALGATDSTKVDKMFPYVHNTSDEELAGTEWAKSPVDNDKRED